MWLLHRAFSALLIPRPSSRANFASLARATRAGDVEVKSLPTCVASHNWKKLHEFAQETHGSIHGMSASKDALRESDSYGMAVPRARGSFGCTVVAAEERIHAILCVGLRTCCAMATREVAAKI